MASQRAVKDRTRGEPAVRGGPARSCSTRGRRARACTSTRERPGVEDIIDQIVAGVRSACTYAGAPTLDQLHQHAVVGVQTQAGYFEGQPVGTNWYRSRSRCSARRTRTHFGSALPTAPRTPSSSPLPRAPSPTRSAHSLCGTAPWCSSAHSLCTGGALAGRAGSAAGAAAASGREQPDHPHVRGAEAGQAGAPAVHDGPARRGAEERGERPLLLVGVGTVDHLGRVVDQLHEVRHVTGYEGGPVRRKTHNGVNCRWTTCPRLWRRRRYARPQPMVSFVSFAVDGVGAW